MAVPVSYTHLDVYKRQSLYFAIKLALLWLQLRQRAQTRELRRHQSVRFTFPLNSLLVFLSFYSIVWYFLSLEPHGQAFSNVLEEVVISTWPYNLKLLRFDVLYKHYKIG